MAKPEVTESAAPKRGSKLPLLIGLVCAILGAGGAFYAVYSGGSALEPAAETALDIGPSPMNDIAFIPLTPMVIALGEGGSNRHLRFQAHLEVEIGAQEQVTFLEPRIMDVLNTYLRAVDIEDLESRRSLIRLRAQMLRRIQIVTGGDQVRDLLITEFVLT